MKHSVLSLSTVLALGLPGVARAHDFWLEPQGGALVLRYGHRGGESLTIEASKIKSIRCLPASGEVRELVGEAKLAAKEVRVTATCSVASAFYDGGFWSLTPDGEKNLPKSKCPDAVKSWESKQLAKWVDAKSPSASRVLGDELEIVPVTDLSKVKAGDKATFRVVLQGKPVNGAIVAIDHKPLGETDSAGEIRIRLRAPERDERESISASLRRPVSSPDADAQVFEASLSFEIAK